MNPDTLPAPTPPTISPMSDGIVVPQPSVLENSSVLTPATPTPLKSFFGYRPKIRKPGFFVVVSSLLGGLLIILLAITINRMDNSYEPQNTNNDEAYTLASLSLSRLNTDLATALGQISQLDINGNLRVNGSVVVTPSEAPANPVIGQIYVDNQTNQLYFYDGDEYQMIVTAGNSGDVINIPDINIPTVNVSGFLTNETDPSWSTAKANYFNLNQNEVVTGIPAFNGGATGSSAPFGVDSNYKVTNLNADLLDGHEASDFALAGGGGMTNPMSTLGDLIYGGLAGTPTRLGGNTTTDTYVLTSIGDGINTNIPSWSALSLGGLGGVPTSRTLSINGTSYDLSANRSWSVGDMLLGTAQSVTALKTFDNSMLAMKGTSTGVTTIATANTSANNYTLTLPAATGVVALTSDLHSAVTLGTANGLGLSTQQLSLALASAATTGALSDTDWNIFNNKQPAGSYLTAEADDLADVTGRGANTSTASAFNGGLTASSLTVNNLSTAGIVTNTAAGVIGTVATVDVVNGGTGAATFAQYGVLYGNTTSAIQATAAGATGQCLIGTTGAAPSWGTCPGDSSVPTSRTLSINGTSYDLSANRSWSVGDMLLGTAQSVTALKTFDSSMLAMKGTSTGVTTIATANTSASNYTITLPSEAGTVCLQGSINCGFGDVQWKAAVANAAALPTNTENIINSKAWGEAVDAWGVASANAYPITGQGLGTYRSYIRARNNDSFKVYVFQSSAGAPTTRLAGVSYVTVNITADATYYAQFDNLNLTNGVLYYFVWYRNGNSAETAQSYGGGADSVYIDTDYDPEGTPSFSLFYWRNPQYKNTSAVINSYLGDTRIQQDTKKIMYFNNSSWDILNPDVTLGGLGGVPTSRTLSINGTSYDLSANRSWSVGDMLLGTAQSVTALKTFDNSMLAMKGTSTGVTTIATANTSASNYTVTLPSETGTVCLQGSINCGFGDVQWKSAVANAAALPGVLGLYASVGGVWSSQFYANYSASTDWHAEDITGNGMGIYQFWQSRSNTNASSTTLRGYIYTNNGGVPGTLVATSDSTVTPGPNAGDAYYYSFSNANLTQSTTYWLVTAYISGDRIFLERASSSGGNAKYGTDGLSWSNAGGYGIPTDCYFTGTSSNAIGDVRVQKDTKKLMYWDGSIWASINPDVTASNGLTATAPNVKLGGTLSENTTITQGNYNMVYNVSGTGYFDVQHDAASVLRVADGGNVGIGDTSPDQKLEVMNTGTALTQLTVSNTNAGDYDSQIGFELTDGTNLFTMGIDDSDSDKFKISTTGLGTGDRLVIDSSGNVGIGTAMPGYALDVAGNAIHTAAKLNADAGASLNSTSTNNPLVVNKNVTYDVTATWSSGTSDTSYARYAHSAVVYNNKMYVFGGINGGSYLDTLRVYDFATGSWSAGTADTGNIRGYHSAVVYNNKMYVYGGGNGSIALDTMRIYDFATGSWSAGTADTGNGRLQHSAVVYNNKMYVFGGFDGSALDTMRIYDFATGSWSAGTADTGITRYRHAAVVYGDKMYVYDGNYDGSLRIYNFTTDAWSAGASDGTYGRYAHSAAVYNNNMYVFGGYSSGVFGTVRIYNFAANTWSSGVTDGSYTRYYHAAVVYNNNMYVYGGIYSGALDVLRIYDFGIRQNILAVQENNISSFSFQTGQILNLDQGKMAIMAGNVGISNTSPGYLLHVGSASVADGTAVARFENAGGTCTVTPNTAGGITCTSDERLKKDITTYGDALNQILGLRTVSYHMLADAETDTLHVGFIAQEYEQLFPDLVYTDAQGIKSISYAGLTPYLATAIQQQQQTIEELSSRVATLSSNLQYNSDLNLTTITGNLTVTGNVQVANLSVSSDLQLAAKVNTRQAITKKFYASKPIAAGSVVVIDNTRDGYITTTEAEGDTKVIGVIVEEAFAEGDEVGVAIGGNVQVQVDRFTTVAGGDMIIAGNQEGIATVSVTPSAGSLLGKATSTKDANNLVWILITLQ